MDLATAFGLLAADGFVPKERLAGLLFIGELALDGHLRPVAGTLPIAIAARRAGMRAIVVPRDRYLSRATQALIEIVRDSV